MFHPRREPSTAALGPRLGFDYRIGQSGPLTRLIAPACRLAALRHDFGKGKPQQRQKAAGLARVFIPSPFGVWSLSIRCL